MSHSPPTSCAHFHVHKYVQYLSTPHISCYFIVYMRFFFGCLLAVVDALLSFLPMFVCRLRYASVENLVFLPLHYIVGFFFARWLSPTHTNSRSYKYIYTTINIDMIQINAGTHLYLSICRIYEYIVCGNSCCVHKKNIDCALGIQIGEKGFRLVHTNRTFVSYFSLLFCTLRFFEFFFFLAAFFFAVFCVIVRIRQLQQKCQYTLLFQLVMNFLPAPFFASLLCVRIFFRSRILSVSPHLVAVTVPHTLTIFSNMNTNWNICI